MIKLLFLIVTIISTLSYTTIAFPENITSDESNGYIVKVNVNQRALRFVLTDSIEEIGQGKGVYFAETQNDVERLKFLGEIEYIEPNYEVTLFGTPNDEYYTEQTNLHIINVESAWNIGCYGNDVRIGVIDSGVYNHPDLNGSILPGYNYRDNNTDTDDTNGHGTFVSGLIAAQRNDIGIVGVAHKAKIIPLKCFGTGMTTSLKTIVDAIYGAVDDFDCEIINMSFGLAANTDSLADAVRYAVSKGVIVVAAVGNDGTDKIYYPAAYESVIGVGSVNDDKSVSSFSQKNTSVFVTAPGNAVKSLSINGDYKTDNGTSFSAPLVTGAMAVIKCIDEFIDTDKAMALLIESSEDLGGSGYDVNFGYGLINVQALANKMLEGFEWFVSPLDISGEKYTAVVFNNSGSERTITSIFSSYARNKLIKTSILNVKLLAGESTGIDFEQREASVKHFLWSDIGAMTPLYKVRQTN